MNLLLKKFDTAFGTVPFSKIKNKDFSSAIPKAIAFCKAEIDHIVDDKTTPTFANTIEKLEKAGEILSQATSILFNLNSAETSEELQKITQEVSPLLSEHSNDISLNEKLFEKIKYVWNKLSEENLDIEQKTLLEKTYKGFVRNGALLCESEKEELRAIDKKTSELSLKFGENLLKETNNYFLQVKEGKRLSGIPESQMNAAKEEAEKRKLSGWVFTLNYPSYVPFMKYCPDRVLRKEMYIQFGSKSFKNNELDNQKHVLDLVNLRYKRANLLGFKHHAHFVLEERMAKDLETVNNFSNDLLKKVIPIANAEKEELKKIAEKDGVLGLESWDHAYYSEKLRKEKFDLSEEELKVYFPLDAVEKGAFEIAKKLFGISLKKVKNVDVYHSEVNTFEVLDEKNNHLAILYTDYFPREGKRAGAWMTSYRSQNKTKTPAQRPHISIVCNFSKPSNETPSLLTFEEVKTLFHEFGHALHGILADTKYASLSGTSVLWDFVELPSQFMENYCYKKEALSLFAKHYETGEIIPDSLIDKLNKASKFMVGYQTIRQISFGMLDMAWHGNMETKPKSVGLFEDDIMENTSLYPKCEKTNMSCSFAHIFQGGYSAGYYSYKWAEVLDADAFAYFEEKGIFNKEIATKFRKVLSRGGTIKPMELYKEFRGQEPTNKALLKRYGLVE